MDYTDISNNNLKLRIIIQQHPSNKKVSKVSLKNILQISEINL